MRQRRQDLWLAGCCLLCFVLTQTGEPGEAIGGWLTGPMWQMADAGTALFVVALVLAFMRPRPAAVVAVIACALTAPLWLYFTAPDVFTWIFGGAHKGPSGFFWSRSQIMGLLALAVTTCVSIRRLLHDRSRSASGISGPSATLTK
jgi:hypothetical protein